MHQETCVTHVPWSLNCGGGGKCSRHSRNISNSQFYVSSKRPMETHSPLLSLCEGIHLWSVDSLHKAPAMLSFNVFNDIILIKPLNKSRIAGDLRHHDSYTCDTTAKTFLFVLFQLCAGSPATLTTGPSITNITASLESVPMWLRVL